MRNPATCLYSVGETRCLEPSRRAHMAVADPCSRRAAHQGGDFPAPDGPRDLAVVAGHSPTAALVKICWKATTFAISARRAARTGHRTDSLRIYLNSLAEMR